MNIENKLLEILKILGEVTPEQISYELKIDLVKKTNEAINYTRCCTEFKCEKCDSDWGEIRATCFNCQHESGDLST